MPEDQSAPPLHPYLAEVIADEWLWREMGGEMILVTAHGGARVVIAPPSSMRRQPPAIMVPTAQDGGGHVLRPIKPDHPIAIALAALPDMAKALRALSDRTLQFVGPKPVKGLDCDDEMRALAKAGHDALRKAGVL